MPRDETVTLGGYQFHIGAVPEPKGLIIVPRRVPAPSPEHVNVIFMRSEGSFPPFPLYLFEKGELPEKPCAELEALCKKYRKGGRFRPVCPSFTFDGPASLIIVDDGKKVLHFEFTEDFVPEQYRSLRTWLKAAGDERNGRTESNPRVVHEVSPEEWVERYSAANVRLDTYVIQSR